jgi:NAD(P)H-nitrite reductase large subunit
MRADSIMPALEPTATLLCRCEEVASDDIAAALATGAVTLDDVKRRTRAGMGVCQGIFCMPVIAALVAEATGTGIELIAPMTSRPPVRAIPLEALSALGENVDESRALDELNGEGS